MNLPDGNALDFMEAHKKNASHAEWVFLTGYGSVPDSVRALRLGAYDFLEKPCDLDRLDLIVASAARSAAIQRRVIDQTKQKHRRYTPDAFVGKSAQAQQVREILTRLTQVPFSALIMAGESGTGSLHGFMMAIMSAATDDRSQLRSSAKGTPGIRIIWHEPGAFTGASGRHRGLLEQADGGTLFMDEIGEMPLDLQAKLLKVIEDHKVRRLGGEKKSMSMYKSLPQAIGILRKWPKKAVFGGFIPQA